MLIVISAPSGAGKSTLCQRLLRDFSVIELSISCTTRSPRGDEKDGIHYFFLTREVFESKVRQKQFAEWAEVHGHLYGTSKEFIERIFAKNHSVLLDIDVQGADQLRQVYPKDCLSIFIAPPSLQELEIRLRKRATDSEETIQRRLRGAQSEMSQSHKFDATIVNDSLERAYTELKELIQTRLQSKIRVN
jgi:guanylate kinase